MMKKNFLFLVWVLSLVIVSATGVFVVTASQELRFSLLNQDPDPVEPGNYVEVRFAVQNYGYTKTTNVIVEIMPEYPFSLEPGASKTKNIGVLLSRQLGEEKVTLFYKLRVDENAIEGNNEIKMKYSPDNGVTWTKLEAFTLRVRSLESILSVEDISTLPEKVGPGETIKVTVKLKNRASSLLKNIKATLSLYTTTATGATTTYEELPFTPFSKGVEKTIEKLSANEEKEVSFNLIVDADAKNKPYKMPLTITYSDQFGQSFSKSNIVGIVVYKKPDYNLNLEDSDIYTNNQKGRITVSISNTGPSDINYLSIKLKRSSDFEILSTERLYLGNLESDDYETAEFELFVKTEKDSVPLYFELSYKDSYNTDYIDTVTVPGLNLFKKKDAVKYGLIKPTNTFALIMPMTIFGLLALFWVYMFIDCLKNRMTRHKKILWIVAFFIANIVGAALYYFIARRRKKRVE